ncbi:MAG: transposase, partial [Gammaproteobacteria bacterium]
VMNRGRERQIVFHTAKFYEVFLKGLDEAYIRFGMEIHAYCLMGNHYYLLIKTPQGNLSRIMRHIDGLYTQRHNRLKKTDGPLFRGRYKAIVIDASQYLLQVSRYIHRNPVEMKKPLVEVLENYRWSSYPAYIGLDQAPRWLNRDTVYGEMGSQHRYRAYKTYVNQSMDRKTSEFYRLKHTPSVLGDRQFREEAQKRAISLDREIDKKGLKHPVPLPRIIKAVASYYQEIEPAIKQAKRGRGNRNIPRWIAMKLCQDVGSAKLTEIAKEFEVGHYATVSKTIGRLNRLMKESEQYERDYNILSQDLTP